MIDPVKLRGHRQAFGFFARQLAYPDEHVFGQSPAEGEFAPPVYEMLMKYWQAMSRFSMDEIEEMYVQTFDFRNKTTLYMTYFKFEDSKERGQMLAKLKAVYELFGLEIANGELPDYLPLMLEFLYAAEWPDDARAEESLSLLLAVLEDGTYHLLNALSKQRSPYADLVKALRETFKSCLPQEAGVHG